MERLLSHPGLGFSWVTAFKPVSLPGAGSAPASFGVSAPEKTVGRNGAARTSFHPLPPGFAPGPLIVIAMMSPTIRSRREEAFQDD